MIPLVFLKNKIKEELYLEHEHDCTSYISGKLQKK